MATAFNPLFDQNDSPDHMTANSVKSQRSSHIRACTNCVRAKARCSTSVDAEGRCERCHRMKKVCQPSAPVQRQRTLKKSHPPGTSKLEEKLDGLVTLLKSATQGVPDIINSQISNSLPIASTYSDHGTANKYVQGETYSETPTNTTRSYSTPATILSLDQSSITNYRLNSPFSLALEPNTEEAQVYLHRFRNEFVPNLPFIVISPNMTAYQLRQERPLLWISIMSVASTKSAQQMSLSKEVRSIFAREVFVEGTRSMDLLLALLVYANWDRRFHFGRPILISLVQAAIAVLYDLGLDKPPSNDPAIMLAYELKGGTKPNKLLRTPTNEERRALLGCFLLSSVSCFTLRKGNTLRWTVYANQCLSALEAEKEFESDALLVQLIKLRLFSERVNDLPWSTSVAQIDSVMTAPVSFYLKSLEIQLQELKSHISPQLLKNKILLTELHTTERIIYEVGLSQAPDIFRGQENRRIECLWALTNASKSWVDVFFSIPPLEYVGFSALMYSNMTHCFLSVYRLTTFDHAEWDRILCIQHLDVGSFMDQGARNFAAVKEVAGLHNDGEALDTFSIMASRIQIIKMSWDTATASLASPTNEILNDAHHDLYDFPIEFSDGDWLKDLIGSWHD